MSGRCWTFEEVETLKRRYPHESPQVIANDMGRSLKSLQARAYILGVKNRQFWSADELERFREIYPYHSNNELGRMFGRSKNAIAARGSIEGLRKEPAERHVFYPQSILYRISAPGLGCLA